MRDPQTDVFETPATGQTRHLRPASNQAIARLPDAVWLTVVAVLVLVLSLFSTAKSEQRIGNVPRPVPGASREEIAAYYEQERKRISEEVVELGPIDVIKRDCQFAAEMLTLISINNKPEDQYKQSASLEEFRTRVINRVDTNRNMLADLTSSAHQQKCVIR